MYFTQYVNDEFVEVRKSRIHGKGIFTLKSFKKGERITKIDGPHHELVDEQSTEQPFENWVGYGMNEWVEPANKTIFTNHSCNPTAGLDNELYLVALRDIPAGTEVTFDYAISERVIMWRMRCRCRSTNCRDIISSIQMVPEFVYNRYLPFIPDFFQRIYESYQRRIRERPE